MRGEDSDDTRYRRLPDAQLWVESSRNCSVFLDRPKQGTPREGTGSLSIQPAGYTPWCSTDAVVFASVESDENL